MSHTLILITNTVGAQNISSHPRNFKSDIHIIHFAHRNLMRSNFSRLFKLRQSKSKKMALCNFGNHPNKFGLNELLFCNWLAEHLSLFSVMKLSLIHISEP